MHIFIDESGTFAFPQNGGESPCVLGALVIPDHKIELLYRRYARLRQSFPLESGEVKGRLLDEGQVAGVVELLRKNECIFETIAIEMSRETIEEVTAHRNGAAEALTANLTDKHHINLVKSVWDLRKKLEDMSLPLYVQYTLASQLLAQVVREIPSYWAQRQMNEILDYHWVVDGKGMAGETGTEKWWSSVKMGVLQSVLARKPMILLKGLDYSAFEQKFKVPMPSFLKKSILPHDEGFNLNLLFGESFRFSSSSEYGLELVDVVTNATRRALKGHLKFKGWQGIPSLMIRRRSESLTMVCLSKSANVKGLSYRSIIMGPFSDCGRVMLVG